MTTEIILNTQHKPNIRQKYIYNYSHYLAHPEIEGMTYKIDIIIMLYTQKDIRKHILKILEAKGKKEKYEEIKQEIIRKAGIYRRIEGKARIIAEMKIKGGKDSENKINKEEEEYYMMCSKIPEIDYFYEKQFNQLIEMTDLKEIPVKPEEILDATKYQKKYRQTQQQDTGTETNTETKGEDEEE